MTIVVTHSVRPKSIGSSLFSFLDDNAEEPCPSVCVPIGASCDVAGDLTASEATITVILGEHGERHLAQAALQVDAVQIPLAAREPVPGPILTAEQFRQSGLNDELAESDTPVGTLSWLVLDRQEVVVQVSRVGGAVNVFLASVPPPTPRAAGWHLARTVRAIPFPFLVEHFQLVRAK